MVGDLGKGSRKGFAVDGWCQEAGAVTWLAISIPRRREEQSKAPGVIGKAAAGTHLSHDGPGEGVWPFSWLGQCSRFVCV